MKKLLPWLLTIAALALAFHLWQRKPDPDVWVSKADYDKAAQEAEALHAEDQGLIKAQDVTIVAQDVKISGLLAAAGRPTPAELEQGKKIDELERQIVSFEAQGDLAGALAAAKRENSAWAEKFDLAARTHLESVNALNKAWQVKFDAQVEISSALKRQLEDERALRIAAEGLAEDALRAVKSAKFERTAHDVEGLGVGVWSAVKHKDPLPLALYAAEKLAGKVKLLFTK